MAKQYLVSEGLTDELRDLPRLRAKVDGISGPNVRNTPWTIVIDEPRTGESVRTRPFSEFVRVKQNGGATGNGTDYATWTYDAYSFDDTTCTGSAMDGGPFTVWNSRARLAPIGVTPAATGSRAELVTLPDGTRVLRDVEETAARANCT